MASRAVSHKNTLGQTFDYSSLKLSDAAFKRIGDFIYQNVGIKLPPVKKTMIQARLQKRLRHLSLTTYEAYCDFVFSDQGQWERTHMIDVITTNKTDFFREPAHFDHLFDVAIPDLLKKELIDARQPLNVWSAGCSSGEEPYTLAMLLSDSCVLKPDLNFNILATDISTRILEKARKGIYAEEKIAPVPMDLKKKYLLRSKDRTRKQVRIIPELRHRVRFMQVNFMEDDFGVRQKMHIIFCRNVIIYFDRQTQQRIVGKLLSHLKRSGYLYLGHSETLHGLNLPVSTVAPTVYQKIAEE
ncbi:protein-glutamate O-methyltransferase [bacterium]|nr:protein-glutamate O-methyltransferase [bacterium]